jgi:hypothetical protein
VGAYLFAGDATTGSPYVDATDPDNPVFVNDDKNDKDPWILGTRLSFSF